MKTLFFSLVLLTYMALVSCVKVAPPDLNGDWKVTNGVSTLVSEYIQHFRIEDDTIVTHIYRGYFAAGEGRIYLQDSQLYLATAHEVLEFNITAFDENAISFVSVEEPEEAYVAHKVELTQSSMLDLYLRTPSHINLPLEDTDQCEELAINYRFEISLGEVNNENESHVFVRDEDIENLGAFSKFWLAYERHRVKTPERKRKHIKPVLYADKDVDAADMDSIRSIFYTLGFDTFYLAKLDRSITDLDSFPVCYVPVKIKNAPVKVTLDPSYDKYLCNEKILTSTSDDIDNLILPQIAEFLATIHHSCNQGMAEYQRSQELLYNVTLRYPDDLLHLLAKNSSLDRHEIVRRYGSLGKKYDTEVICDRIALKTNDTEKSVWANRIVEALKCKR